MSYRLLVLCNNYARSYDGIGAYAKVMTDNFSEKLEPIVFTADCDSNAGSLRRVTTLGMTRQAILAGRYIKANPVDCVDIEYPFVEWNPLVVFGFLRLFSAARRAKVRLLLSLHEYERTNRLRKLVIHFLASHCDYIGVSNDTLKRAMEPYCDTVFLRRIPSNMDAAPATDTWREKSHFVYFGLIGRAKAFTEMLEGWDAFAARNEGTLHIISSTKIAGLENRKGVKYHYDLAAEDVMKLMERCSFAVLPVRPCVDEKNATFKTACIAGCIPIGVFSETLVGTEAFRLDMKDYSSAAFTDAFSRALGCESTEILEKSRLAALYGEAYKPHCAIAQLEKTLLEIGEKEKKPWRKTCRPR